jgi:hypothetical protein
MVDHTRLRALSSLTTDTPRWQCRGCLRVFSDPAKAAAHTRVRSIAFHRGG